MLGAALLTITEQGIKLIVRGYLGASLAILPPLVYFQPVFNREYSWLNSMLGLGIGFWAHVILVAGMLACILLAYRCAIKRVNSRYIDGMFAVLIAGALCSLLDKIFWGGSLDYILIKGLFTFDLKDVYINLFIALLFAGWIFRKGSVRELLDFPKDETAELKQKREQ